MAAQIDQASREHFKSSLGKFAIGVVAGLCAALLPRLLAMLAHSDDASLRVLPGPYIAISCVFALLIGGLVVIFEWGIRDTPRNIFMAALALPAVISGAIGTSNGIGSSAEANRQLDRVLQEVRQKDGIIRQGEFGSIQPLDLSPPPAPKQGFWTPLSPITSAHAQQVPGPTAGDTPARFGIYFEQPKAKYVIVLKQTRTEKEAIDSAQDLRRRLPRAQAVKAGNGYYVLLGSADGQNETDALLEASRAKPLLGGTNIQPTLVQLKQ